MTKRSTKRDIDALSDEVLGNLSPTERVRATLQANARDRPEWHERLVETCPTRTYRMPELAYDHRRQWAWLIGYDAVGKLWRLILEFKLTYRSNQVGNLKAVIEGATSSADLPTLETHPRIELANLSWQYHGYEQFADEVFDCELETWLAIHPDGPAVIKAAETLFDRHGTCLEQPVADVYPEDLKPVDDDPVTITGLATAYAAVLAYEWEELVTK